MKENKKNIVFIGVIGILVLVVIILGISLVNEKNKNTNPSDSQPTQKNEQSATVSEQTTAGDAGDMTEDAETTVGEPQTTLAPEDLAAADASMADMIETLISKELTCHTSGDVLYAVADSDREMYSYVTVNDILKNDSWIIEGVYYGWVQQSFDEADIIYVLDMPGYLYKSRIIMRSIKRKLGIQKGKRETLKSVYNLLKWTETFQNKNLKEIRSILDRYDDKVIWLSRKKDVEKIIKAV